MKYTKTFTNAKYIKDMLGNSFNMTVTIDGIVSNVPVDINNTDYAEIMKQVDAGELTIEPADE